MITLDELKANYKVFVDGIGARTWDGHLAVLNQHRNLAAQFAAENIGKTIAYNNGHGAVEYGIVVGNISNGGDGCGIQYYPCYPFGIDYNMIGVVNANSIIEVR